MMAFTNESFILVCDVTFKRLIRIPILPSKLTRWTEMMLPVFELVNSVRNPNGDAVEINEGDVRWFKLGGRES